MIGVGGGGLPQSDSEPSSFFPWVLFINDWVGACLVDVLIVVCVVYEHAREFGHHSLPQTLTVVCALSRVDGLGRCGVGAELLG